MLCLLLAYPARLCVLARRQGRSAQRVALAMSCVVLWFFMAMRAQTVGVDTKYYVCIYQQFPQISWKELFTAQLYPTPRRTWELDLEPGYRLLNKLLSIYLPAPQWITVANSALIIALLYRWLRRESPNAMLSIWLYLTLGVYQTEMNVARNAIAILLGYTAFHWIKERKLAPYFLQILMAVSFHKSAVVFLPLYWLVNRRWKYRHVLYCTMAACILGAAYPVVAGRVANLLPYALAKYFTKSNSRMESIAVGAFYALLVAFVLYKITPEECKKAGIQGTAGTISHNGGTFAVRAEPWASLCGADGCVVWAVPDRIASTHVGVYKLPAQTGCDNPMVGSGGGPPIRFAAADK